LLHPERFARYRIRPARGITLCGPPGCGKTLIAQALAHRLAERASDGRGYFVLVKGPELLSMWVGESERLIRQIIRAARQLANRTGELVFLFWDEIDAIARTRGASRFSSVEGSIVPTLLTEIQGFESETAGTLIVCAATNRPDLLDPALLRPGRLGDLILEIPRPNRSAAREIFAKKIDPALLDREESLDDLLERTLARIYAPAEENTVASLLFRDGGRQPLRRQDLISGATIEKVVSAAARQACLREVDLEQSGGIRTQDLAVAVEQEFAEVGKVLKPHNIREYVALPEDREVVAVERAPVRPRSYPLLPRA
jgi:proteasome-associated ATPase